MNMVKRSFFVLVVICCSSLLFAQSEYVVDTYIILPHDDGTCTIVDYFGWDDIVVIPTELDGYIVTKIGNSAFDNEQLIEIVSIPSSVTSIGENAFEECTNIWKIVILGDSITSIGKGAFKDCHSLQEIILPPHITSIEDETFSSCYSLMSITIPKGVTSIGSDVFQYSTSLENIFVEEDNEMFTHVRGVLFNKKKKSIVKYPSGNTNTHYSLLPGITHIEEDAFYEAEHLVSISIPESVRSIGKSAFVWCTSLKNITIPKNVAYIGEEAFRSCDSLEYIEVDKKNTTYIHIDGVLFNSIEKSLVRYPSNKKDTSYRVPHGIIATEVHSFNRSKYLKEVTFLPTVTSLGNGSFYQCTSLEHVVLPQELTSIPRGLFAECSSLTHITIPNNVTSIGSLAFLNCSSLENIVIPDKVTTIGTYALSSCSSLETIDIPISVIEIGEGAFFDSLYLKAINVIENSYAHEYLKNSEYAHLVNYQPSWLL